MPTLTPTQLSDLRETRHRVDAFISFLKPATLWTARVNNGSAAREDQTIPFNGGSGSAFAAVAPHQTVWVGSTPGAKDIGRARIKSISSGDGGVTGTLVVGANPLIWADNLYLTFKHEYRLWAVFPRIATDETFYKDWDVDGGITYSDQNTNLYPVAIAGPNRAGFLSGGSLIFNIPIGDSYAMAPGATITSRSVSVYPTTGVTVGAFAGGVIPITYTSPGQYWVKTTVTDSNGKSQDTYRVHFVHEDDPDSADYPFRDFSKLTISGDWQQQIWEADFGADDESSLDDIPDETVAVVWQRAHYGDNERDVSLVDEGSNILVSGYLVKDSRINVDLQKGGDVDFSIVTLSGIMQNHFMYSVSIASESTVNRWWKFRSDALSTGRALHHLYRWHSTVLHICDFLRLNEDLSLRKATDIERGGLLEMGQLYADASRRRIVADKTGRLHYVQDICLSEDADRAGYTEVAELTERDIVDPLVLSRNPQRRVSFVFASGFDFDGSTATPIGSTAPSKWPSPFGAKEIHLERLILNDQSESNELAGQVFARENRVLVEVRAEMSGNYLGALDVAYPEWWTLNLSSSDNVRELTLVDQKIVCRGVRAEYMPMEGVFNVTAYFEPEVDGEPGVPYEWPDETPDPGGVDPVIPTSSLTAIMTSTDTNSTLYFLGDQDSAWSVRQTWDILHFGKDPFWLQKASTEFAQGAILYVGREGYIGRSTNSGISFTEITPSSDPPNSFGDSPAPTAGDLSYMCYKGSLIVPNQHCFLANYQNGDDKWRSWLLFTDDDGSSWTWIPLISGGGGGGWTEVIAGNEIYDDSGFYGPGISHIHPLSNTALEFNGKIYFALRRDPNPTMSLFEVDPSDGSVGTNRNFNGGATDDEMYQGQAVALSSTRIALANDSIDDGQLHIDVYDDSWSTLGADDIDPVGTGSGTVGSLNRLLAIGSIDEDSLWIMVTGSSGGTRVISYTLDGLGGLNQVTNTEIDVNQADWASSCRVRSGLYGDHIWHVYYHTTSGIRAARIAPLLGGACEVGTPHLITSDDGTHLAAAPIGDETSICFFHNNNDSSYLNAVCVELTSSVGISQGAVTRLSTDVPTAINATGDTDNEVLVAYLISSGVPMKYATVTMGGIDGLTPSMGATSDYSWNGGGYPLVLKASGSTYIGGRRPDDDGIPNDVDDDYVVTALSADQSKGIWMDISRGDGSKSYVTGWNGVSLSLFEIDLTTTTVTNEYILGNATETQLDDREYIAYPLCFGVEEDNVLVGGRMNNPAGLGNPVHLMASDDAGATFVLMNDDLGDDHFCAAIEDAFGLIYIVKNRADGQPPQLYDTVAGAPASVVSTIPIEGQVNPGNITTDFDYSVIILAGDPSAKMVVISAPPFTDWLDVTLNHGITKSGTAVEVL
jgi:hypothetical protein